MTTERYLIKSWGGNVCLQLASAIICCNLETYFVFVFPVVRVCVHMCMLRASERVREDACSQVCGDTVCSANARVTPAHGGSRFLFRIIFSHSSIAPQGGGGVSQADPELTRMTHLSCQLAQRILFSVL